MYSVAFYTGGVPEAGPRVDTVVLAEACKQGAMIAIKADGLGYLASAAAGGPMPVAGMADIGGAIGDTITLIRGCDHVIAEAALSGTPSLTLGQPVFLSATALDSAVAARGNTVTSTAPSSSNTLVQTLGIAIHIPGQTDGLGFIFRPADSYTKN